MVRVSSVYLVVGASIAGPCAAEILDVIKSLTGDLVTTFSPLPSCWKNNPIVQPACARLPMLYACNNASYVILDNIEAPALALMPLVNLTNTKLAVAEIAGFLNASSVARKYSCVDGHDIKQLMLKAATGYDVPTGCTCRRMKLDVGDPKFVAVTTKRCARSAGVYDATTLVQESQLPFSHLGCFVGNASEPSSHKNCTSAVASLRFKGAMFARCVNTKGEALGVSSLDDTFYL